MIVCAPYALLRGHRGRLVRSRARTDIWGTDIRPARSGAERARRPNKREQRQPAPAPAGGTLGAQATPAGVWLPPAAAGARQRAEHPPAERTPSFFVVLLPLPREGVGGGPIITERSEASARRRPQPPERSRVAICSQPSQLLRIDHPRRGLGSICKSPLLRTARRNLFRSRLQPKRQGTRSVSVGAPPPDRRSHYDILSIFP